MIPLGVLGAAGRAPSPGGILGYFANGERGFWIDPLDLASMHQDVAGTVPVTGVGQSVQRILDRTANGIVFSQPATGKAPTLQDVGGQMCLDFSAALSQFLATPADSDIAPRADSIMVVAAVEVDSLASLPVIFSRSVAAGWPGRYWLQLDATSAIGNWTPTSGAYAVSTPSGTTKRIVSMMVNRSLASPSHGLHVRSGGGAGEHGAIPGESDDITRSIQGRIGAYGNATDTGETTNYFDGRMFGLIVRLTPTPSLSDLEGLEAELAAHVGL